MELAVTRNKTRGVLLTVAAAFSFGLIPYFAKIAYSGGFNPFSFSLFRSVFTALVLTAILKANNSSLKIEKKQLPTLLRASVFGYSLMMLTLFSAYNYMGTGLATTLHFIYPVATMAGAILFYKDKATPLQIGAIAISLPGIYLLVGAGSSGGFTLHGTALALASGLFYAYYILTISDESIKEMNSLTVILYISVFNSFIFLPTALLSGNLSLNVTGTGFLGVIMVVLIPSVIGMVAFQEGLREISPTAAAILSTFEVVTSLLVGIVVLDETLSSHQLTGCFLIMASVIAAALPEKQPAELHSRK